jgi:hypothetical protein
MLPTESNGLRSSEHGNNQARPSHPGVLSRLLLRFRPPWHADYFLQKPRRAVDRDLQEQWPVDYTL